MTATPAPTALRIRWAAKSYQTERADIVQHARQTNESHSRISGHGEVSLPNGKSYFVDAVRDFDRAAPHGQRVTWDIGLRVRTSTGTRLLPESSLPEVRAFCLWAFKRAVSACADSGWDCGDDRWPRVDPLLAAVEDYAAAVEDMAATAEHPGAVDPAVNWAASVTWHRANVQEHRQTHDWRGLFDIAATESGETTCRNLAMYARARRAGYEAGRGPVDRKNPHGAASPQFMAWAEGYAEGKEAAPVQQVRRNNVEYHEGQAARRDSKPQTDCPYSLGERANRWQLGWAEGTEDPMPRTAETIDMTPTWAAILPIHVACLEHGSHDGSRAAKAELARMAALADERNVFAAKLAELEALAQADANCTASHFLTARNLRAAFPNVFRKESN